MTPDLNSYDHIVVALSGGKDSVACLLHLLELGVPKERIEAWHHLVDGRESNLMDWPVSEDYVKILCQSLKIPLYFSWREGGIEREMLRLDSPTAATFFESPEGLRSSGGQSKIVGTRMKFPQVAADLKVRWCSAYAKISIADSAIANQPRFKGKRTLVVTGERRCESSSRAKYLEFEPHRTNCKSRHVDHWRPVIDWGEEVWHIAERWSLVPHPCYYLGFGRASCQLCIFSSDDQLASVYKIAPERVQAIADYEKQFAQHWGSYTIHRKYSVMERVARGTPFNMRPEHIQLALSPVYYESIVASDWELPQGATGDMSGPT